ncbi:MAG: glycosyltransferase family 4 protein [Blastocatellia bacterium]
MKILALMTDSYNGFGGIAQYNRDVIDALNQSSQVEKIVSLTRNFEFRISNFEKAKVEKGELRLGKISNSASGSGLPQKLTESTRAGNPAAYAVEALRIARRLRPDLILCGHMNLLPVAAAAAKLTKCRLVLETYGIEAWTRAGRLVSRCTGAADLVLAISRYTRDRFLSWSPVEPYKVKVVCNAIRLDDYALAKAPAYLVGRYKLEGKCVLLTLGRLSTAEQYKGQDRVIKLLPDLVKTYPNLVLLVAGDGDDLPRLKHLVEQFHMEEHLVFTGRISDEEKVDYYNLADAFAMPSTGEGFGFVFLEAAACGLPVLGGSVDGSRDALLDGELGLLVDPNDSDELLAGLREILKRGKKIPAALARFGFQRFRSQIESLLLAGCLYS